MAEWLHDGEAMTTNQTINGVPREPIYQVRAYGEGWQDVDKARYEYCADLPGYKFRIVYAEQPAPVAVVMPERIENHDSGPTLSKLEAKGWNACLDEVTRLNPKE
jgi:hypothetical protein